MSPPSSVRTNVGTSCSLNARHISIILCISKINAHIVQGLIYSYHSQHSLSPAGYTEQLSMHSCCFFWEYRFFVFVVSHLLFYYFCFFFVFDYRAHVKIYCRIVWWRDWPGTPCSRPRWMVSDARSCPSPCGGFSANRCVVSCLLMNRSVPDRLVPTRPSIIMSWPVCGSEYSRRGLKNCWNKTLQHGTDSAPAYG